MRNWILILMMGALFAFPSFAFAQEGLTIESIEIKLWPEYDKADMLVIDYILLSTDTQLPAILDLRIPADVGSPFVVAVGSSLDLVTDQGVNYTTRVEGDWLVVSIEVTGPAIQFEYYDPGLKKDGSKRTYSYEWTSDYAVQNLYFTVQKPFDATVFSVTPELQDDGIHQDQMQYFASKPISVAPREVVSLDLKYEKQSDTLSASRLQVQPVGVDENTPGRVSFSNALPYVVGGLGLVMIIGGLVYYWQSGRSRTRHVRRRKRPSREEGEDETSVEYCPQCGTRAKPGDRFCRVCGARMRRSEE